MAYRSCMTRPEISGFSISMALAHSNRGTLRSRMELVDAASAIYVGHTDDEGSKAALRQQITYALGAVCMQRRAFVYGRSHETSVSPKESTRVAIMA